MKLEPSKTRANALRSNDVSATGLVKFDSPALVLWNAAHTTVDSNYVHDTSSRALYVGGPAGLNGARPL